MTRQAETRMIQPCSEDGGEQGETAMPGEGGGVDGEGGIHRAHGGEEKGL